MTELRRVAVIAGNYREFVAWCRENGHPLRGGLVFYATDDALCAASGVDVVRTGTWQLRRDLAEVESALAVANHGPAAAAGHTTCIGWEPLDLLYFGRCSCGAGRYFLTWEQALGWRDAHETEPA